MSAKTILITGSTDGLGLEAAKQFAALGHSILMHGRSRQKLDDALAQVRAESNANHLEGYLADLSHFDDVEALAREIRAQHNSLDVLINNAGVFKLPSAHTPEGLDLRFLVNTIAPYLLTKRFLPLMGPDARVINLSSAAQAPVDLKVLAKGGRLSDNDAYAQSKLALTAWSRAMAQEIGDRGPIILALNPGSFLATKMVKQAYGVDGKDLSIGADILLKAALSDDFASASGQYFDNDSGRFATPLADATEDSKSAAIVQTIEEVLRRQGISV